MKKKLLPLLLFFIFAHVTHAVAPDEPAHVAVDSLENPSDAYLPLVQNYPSFMLELLRMDYLYNLDSNQSIPFHSMKKFNWSGLLRGNGAMLYAIRLNQSRFAFCAGLGWSTLHYAFAGTEGQDRDGKPVYPRLIRRSESRTLCEEMEHKQGKTILGTALKIPFIDFLFRLRFNSVLDDPKAGFHTWLGVRLGFRRRASMLIDYKEYSDSGASLVEHAYFNLKKYAFGFQVGIGYSRFGVTGGFHLTPLFEKNQGPDHANSLRPFSFGMYVDLI
ncbi:MAG: hypothetical protein V3581_02390 [Candidatus Cardinium sp.]|uniref:hypothetical protein n=1 Tax=Candidatus Cardinium sp. TP TaxID=2961955 RepID=UPI0021AF987D|nr:hypothetical protein [Candidatus Cardinium sp. TP]MCT4696991.1 hypothetical protein [Candidatus Cardinium sp. TP]MDN5246992.1 hypothetical protein [Candidatus Cardinium sp.]